MPPPPNWKKQWKDTYNGHEEENGVLKGTYLNKITHQNIIMQLNIQEYKDILDLSDSVTGDSESNLNRIHNFMDKYGVKVLSLDGADLSGLNLTSAGTEPSKRLIIKASLINSNCNCCNFRGSNISGSDFTCANIQEAVFSDGKFVNSIFSYCEGQESKFYNADLTSTLFINSNLANSNFEKSILIMSDLSNSYCNNTRFESADFNNACINNMQYIPSSKDNINKLNFSETNVRLARISQQVESMLEYNIRKTAWEQSYQHSFKTMSLAELEYVLGESKYNFKKLLSNLISSSIIYIFYRLLFFILKYSINFITKIFWFFTDYGYSTFRIFISFFAIALFFTFIYWCSYDSLLYFTEQTKAVQDDIPYFTRCFYFSIATMTTLGFGDIAAKADNIFGHALIIFQVFLGYIFLGALITRISNLFNSNGPTVTPKEYRRIYPQYLENCLDPYSHGKNYNDKY